MTLFSRWMTAPLIAGTLFFLCAAGWTRPASAQQVIISEFMAANASTLKDPQGNYSDWIELYNPGPQTVSLAGYALTDTSSNPQKWIFPNGCQISPNRYLIVYASGTPTTNTLAPATNFKLSAEGEYLAFVAPNGTILQEFSPNYPPQYPDVSYGILPDGSWDHMVTPTPRAANIASPYLPLAPVVFSQPRGFRLAPFFLVLSCATEQAEIRYTLDGSPPTPASPLYSEPILIQASTVVRARAFRSGYTTLSTQTRTYLFMNSVLNQPALPQGYPTTWGWDPENKRLVPADYEMDPEIVQSPLYGPMLPDSLRYLPTVSIATAPEHLFDYATGIYCNTQQEGVQWERPASVEWINPDGSTAFQVDAGLRIQGGYSRHPKFAKHSFRLLFKDEYGPSRLEYPLFDAPDSVESFNTLTLRANFNDGYDGGWSSALFMRDEFGRQSQRDMGHPSSHGTFVHLYINGLYWGLYNPVERPDASYCGDYFGGDQEDWDVFNTYQLKDGNWTLWNQMLALCRNGLGTEAAYQRLLGNNPDGTNNPAYPKLIDIENYIDYLILNHWGGNFDWPHNNWYAGINRVKPDGFKFSIWDYEGTVDLYSNTDVNANRTTAFDGIAEPYGALIANESFRKLFAERVQKHLFNGGALSPEVAAERFLRIAEQVRPAIVAESARWGDWASSTPLTPQMWQIELDAAVNNFILCRNPVLIQQYRALGLYPNLDMPVILLNGRPVYSSQAAQQGDQVEFRTNSVDVYYTIDGSDPQMPDGSLNPAAIHYVDPFVPIRLLPRGSVWKYQDQGLNLGTLWRLPGYDDSAWASGPAELGYGDGDEATVVSYGSNSLTKPITTYFRRNITLEDTSLFDRVLLRLKRDDGAVVYLNGLEIVRTNLPAGDIHYLTQASVASDDGNEWLEYEIAPSLFVNGNNSLAVEIHQSSVMSTDISFDLEIDYLLPPPPDSRPLTLTGSTLVQARAFDGAQWSMMNSAFFQTDEAIPLAITEIYYHPEDPTAAELLVNPQFNEDDFEFIEIRNFSSHLFPLAGLKFTRGIDFEFPGGLLGPGECVLVVHNIQAFEARFGTGFNIAGEFFDGKLSNSGEAIELRDAANNLLVLFEYRDTPPWDPRADGEGFSLNLLDVGVSPAMASNWVAAIPSPGEYLVALDGDFNSDGVVDLADYTVWADHYGQSGTGLPGDGNNDGVVDLADYTIWADHFGQTR